MTGPGEGVGKEQLPVFRPFEERAAEAGISAVDTIVETLSCPENSWDKESGSVLLWLAGPYASLLRDQIHRDATYAAYNGIYFASGVGSYLMGSRNLPLYPFDRALPRETIRQQVIEDQQTYLSDKPTLQSWLDRHIGAIDPTGTYHDIITAVFSVTLKQLEKKDRQELIGLEAKHLKNDL